MDDDEDGLDGALSEIHVELRELVMKHAERLNRTLVEYTRRLERDLLAANERAAAWEKQAQLYLERSQRNLWIVEGRKTGSDED